MNQTGKKYNKGKTWIAILIIALVIFLGYYQLWHKSKEVESNIFVLKTTVNAHQSDIWSVKFSPNENWFASGSVDSTIKIWNNENSELILTIKQPEGITSIDISPDGNFLASASYDSRVRLWKIPGGLLEKEFVGSIGTVWSVSFSPDGKTIASCGEDQAIKLWSVETGQIVQTLKGHTRNVWDLKFSPDGKYLASGSFDKTVRIWNLSNGQPLQTLSNHTEAVVAIAFSPDGKKLVSTSDDKTIKVWDTRDWKLIHSLETPEHNQAATFSPDNKLLLTAGRDKPALGEFLQNFLGDSEYNKGVSMRLWDAENGQLLQTFSKHSNDVNDVAFSRDGKSIASASSDRTIGLWQQPVNFLPLNKRESGNGKRETVNGKR